MSDVDRIRAERKKARITRNKYGGIEGGSSGIAGGIKGGRYGGFGSESGGYGGYSGGVYGDGGGFGGQSTNNEEEQSGKSGQRTDRFEEYDEYDEGEVASPRNRKTRPTGPPIPSKADLPTSSARKPQPAKAKQPEIDILSFGDDDGPKQTPVKPSFASAADKSAGFGSLQSAGEEDEFGDFTSASPTTSNGANSIGTALFPLTSSGPTPLPKPNYNSLNIPISQPTLAPALQSSTSNPISAHQLKSTSSQAKYQVPAPNYFTSVPVPSVPPTQAKPDSSAFASVTKTSSIPAVQKSNKPAGGDAFGSLWSAVSTSSGRSTPKPTGAGPSMADLAKQKSSQGIWGAASSSTTTNGGATNTLGSQPASNGLDDLLL